MSRHAATLSPEQRTVVIAVSVSAVTLLTLSASFNYVLNYMLDDLNATESQSDMLRQIPSIAALLVIFVAGAIGDRLGARRVMLACCVLFIIGSAITAVAPVMPVATLGLLLANVGRSALFVVALAYMSASVATKDGRAAAFATFSGVMPVSYLVMPLLAGALLEVTTWRVVAAVWVVAGVAGLVAVRVLLPATPASSDSPGEMVTPALAGVVLAAGVQVATMLPDAGMTSRLWVTVTVGAVALLVLIVAMKRMSHPSLSLAPLRHGGLVLLLIVLILTLFANLWFYMTMAFQYIWGLDSLQVALAMTPAQLVSIGGAAVAGWLVQRTGVAKGGAILLVATAAMLFASAALQLDSPLWVSIAITSVYAGAAVGAGVALTNAIMDMARKGENGSASAFRGAANSLGGAMGVAIMTTVVFTAAATSLSDQAVAAGIDPTTASEVATSMRDGATSEDTASLYSVPVDEVDQIDAMQSTAYVAGLRAHGLVGGAVTLAATFLFFVVRRRQERDNVLDRGQAASAGT